MGNHGGTLMPQNNEENTKKNILSNVYGWLHSTMLMMMIRVVPLTLIR